jgi:hypothetical protein
MSETVDVVATRPLLVPAGQIAEGETFTTTKAHADQLIAMEMAKLPAKAKKAEKDG